ncbi:hypothetical protein EW026_g954 [Hermanssonia centrifuga]|uniref:Magnesium transporter n=1 Tax=Hermanssonia centrifuga TaxID=98765 RepID=A0A4S4KT41_9APHY|nr:hypothetical protein EW026_g954 [Hermanssonia centrifuga]
MPTTAQPSFADNVAGGRKGKKGKQRAEQSSIPQTPLLSRTQSESELDRAWWLDISSPTWEDMRAIGKLLHLHPLTLEDILQQDPREKLELFPKLGYYFIVFRAIESQKIRERRRMATIVTTDNRLTYPDEGNIGEVNVYLVVFREGICSFHFSDISDHADSVRSKVLMYAETGTVTMSSDWIAHGIMDSIVDSFFPFLEEIEKEVLNIEQIVYTDEQIVQLLHEEGKPAVKPSIAENSGSDSAVSGDSSLVDEKNVKIILSEKHEEQDVPRTHFSVPTRPPVFLRRFKHFIRKLRTIVSRVNVQVKRPVSSNAAPTTIQRVARMRRLVTSLSRVLATKSEVVAQVKKRLLMTGESGLGNGTVDDHDVFVYMGDVQDHILTLQQSLAHYERMLNQSHPTYLTQLRLSASKSKSGSDKSIMILSIISIGVLCVQGVIGFHSMNIKVPSNRIAPGGHFYVFGVVISLSVVILLIYAMLVRWWWIRARKKRNW